MKVLLKVPVDYFIGDYACLNLPNAYELVSLFTKYLGKVCNQQIFFQFLRDFEKKFPDSHEKLFNNGGNLALKIYAIAQKEINQIPCLKSLVENTSRQLSSEGTSNRWLELCFTF